MRINQLAASPHNATLFLLNLLLDLVILLLDIESQLLKLLLPFLKNRQSACLHGLEVSQFVPQRRYFVLYRCLNVVSFVLDRCHLVVLMMPIDDAFRTDQLILAGLTNIGQIMVSVLRAVSIDLQQVR